MNRISSLFHFIGEKLGNVSMGTTAATVTGAIAELQKVRELYERRLFSYWDGSYTPNGTGWQEVGQYGGGGGTLRITIPANTTGKTIVYAIHGTIRFTAPVANEIIGTSLYQENDDHKARSRLTVVNANEPVTLTPTYIFHQQRNAESTWFALMVTRSGGARAVTECALWAEPIYWY